MNETKVIKEDLTGKDKILWNTFVSWSSHLVLVVSGFIMPRLMGQELGQDQLGSWDFCWTFVTYLKFAGIGVGSASNRYVAKYRAENNSDALSRLVSSVVAIQLVVGISLTIATIAIVYSIPIYLSEKLADNLASIQYVTLFLGISLAINMFFSVSRGILTGYHRWDLHNGLTACYSILSIILMMIMLFSGYGIVGMAQAYLVNTIIFEVLRVYITKRFCKGFFISLSLASKDQCWKLIGFSSKNKLITLPPIFILQSVNFMIVSALGLSALAIFARSLALTRHITTFISKFTMMLTPSISSMLADNQKEELNLFYLTITKLSFAFTLPLVIFLAIFGDQIILWWMGPAYVNHTMIIILALGVLLPASQDSSLRLLMGINQHGKISVYVLIVVLATFLCFYMLFHEQGFSLEVAAFSLVIPLNLAKGILIPIYTCKKLQLSIFSYLYHSILIPLLAVTPFAGLVLLARFLYSHNSFNLSLISLCSASFVLAVSYCFLILTKPQRNKILKIIMKK